MKLTFKGILLALTLVAALNAEETNAQSSSPNVPAEWLTPAEKSNYRTTPNYEETLAYVRRLDAVSPWLRLSEFGRSGEGRALPLVIATKGGTDTPGAARRAGKVVVLVQACIHAGETDGKDAGLALLRDIAVTKEREGLLERAVLLFIPIYNVDGHERRGPYNRPNQNGPAEIGWRANATNLNLNRDYVKADAPETRAWLRLWGEWRPDLFIDCHVTDGADFRYTVTYQFERHQNVLPAVREWSNDFFEKRVIPTAEGFDKANLFSPYMEFRDNRYPQEGINSFIASPRFATGYVPVVRNRPALLIETHVLKDPRPRVRGTYDILRAALEEVNQDSQSLLRAVRLADEQAAAEVRDVGRKDKVVLSVELTDKPTTKLLKTWRSKTSLSEVSGAMRVVWEHVPLDVEAPFYQDARPLVAVSPPLAYVVPPQWREVIGVLAAHGLSMRRLGEATTLEVESYRLREAKFNPSSRGDFSTFEGRVLVNFKSEPLSEKRTYPAGSVVVLLTPETARAALHQLEPDAPDSLARWGFFNSIFEQKEYVEDYILEELAREMLSKDENLRREFERRVASDPAFRGSSSARLRFFYERSPYWDVQMGLYPVGRINSTANLRLAEF